MLPPTLTNNSALVVIQRMQYCLRHQDVVADAALVLVAEVVVVAAIAILCNVSNVAQLTHSAYAHATQKNEGDFPREKWDHETMASSTVPSTVLSKRTRLAHQLL
jgi:hypothetical protein